MYDFKIVVKLTPRCGKNVEERRYGTVLIEITTKIIITYYWRGGIIFLTLA